MEGIRYNKQHAKMHISDSTSITYRPALNYQMYVFVFVYSKIALFIIFSVPIFAMCCIIFKDCFAVFLYSLTDIEKKCRDYNSEVLCVKNLIESSALWGFLCFF